MTVTDLAPPPNVQELRERYRAFMEAHVYPNEQRLERDDALVAELQAAPFPFVMFHPLCGGMPVDLAWSSLRLFEHEVRPAFA